MVKAYRSLSKYADSNTKNNSQKDFNNDTFNKSESDKASKSSKYTSEKSAFQASDSKKKPDLLSESKNGSEHSKKDKTLGILENQQSGNPFGDTEEANSVYYNDGSLNGRPNSNSLNQSIRSKQDKAKVLPHIGKKEGSHGSSGKNSQNTKTMKRHHNSSKKLSQNSRKMSSGRDSQGSFRSKSKQMASYDNGAAKSLDRNMKHQDPKQTIMTAHEPYSRQRLDVMGHSQKDMTQWNEKDRSQITSHQNIRISTNCSKREASQRVQNKSLMKDIRPGAENEFPAISNSVVEDSLPFQGLDNHTHHISLEGFSGARATYYNNPDGKSRERKPQNMYQNAFRQVDQIHEEGGNRESSDSQNDLNQRVNSKKNSSKRLHKIPQNQYFSQGPNGSDSSNQPLANASMSRLTKGQDIYNKGPTIKDGVIDINATYDLICRRMQAPSNELRFEGGLEEKQAQSKSQARMSNKSFPLSLSTKQKLTQEEQVKWGEIMKFFKKHPEFLLDLMPDDVNFQTAASTKKPHHRKGMSMIPDLGIVPPQSGHLGLKRFENEMTHQRKKSHGTLRKGPNGLFKNQLPNKFAYNDQDVYRNTNTPSEHQQVNHSHMHNHYFKPNTATGGVAGEYQTPNFLPSGIEKANNTQYKARIAALNSRGLTNNSASAQKDTTILDKKSIIIESDTEDVAQDSMIEQSQVIQMQNTINLESDTISDAPTKKRSKASDKVDSAIEKGDSVIPDQEDNGQIRTHKRSKNSKLDQQDVKEDDQKAQPIEEEKEKKDPSKKEISQKEISKKDLSQKDASQKDISKKSISQQPSQSRNAELTEQPSIPKTISDQPKSVSDSATPDGLVEERRNDPSLKENKSSDALGSKKAVENAQEGSEKHESRKDPRPYSPSNDTSLHNIVPKDGEGKDIIDHDRKSQFDNQDEQTPHQRVSLENPLEDEENKETLRRDSTHHALPDQPLDNEAKDPEEIENAETLRKLYKDPETLVKMDSLHGNQSPEDHNKIYVKQTIESFRDSQLSQRLEHKSIEYSMNVPMELEDPKKKVIDSNRQSFKPQEDSPGLQDDEESKKSVAISVMKEEEDTEEESKKSVAISNINDDDLRSKKSAAISNIDHDDLRSKKSVALSMYPDKYEDDQSKRSVGQGMSSSGPKSKKSVTLVHPDRTYDNRSKKSIALSMYPEKIEEEQSRKSIALSMHSRKFVDEKKDEDLRSKKSIALSMHSKKFVEEPKEDLRSKKSIALSMNSRKLVEETKADDLRSKKSIALSMHSKKFIDNTPDEDLRSKKSIALSTGLKPELVRKIESKSSDRLSKLRSKKSVGIGIMSNKNNAILESKRSIALSMNQDKFLEEESKKSIALSVTSSQLNNRLMNYTEMKSLDSNPSNSFVDRERSQSVIGNMKAKSPFKPYAYRRDAALSVITHTPTQSHVSEKQSIALSAITHTPTNKTERKSENLSALHLSQRAYDDEEASYASVALSAVKVIESYNYVAPGNKVDKSIAQSQEDRMERSVSAMVQEKMDHSLDPMSQYYTDKSIQPQQNYQTDKSIQPQVNYQSDKSIQPQKNYQTDKSIGPMKNYQTDKSIQPPKNYQTDKSVQPYKNYQTDKSLNPIELPRIDRSVEPRSYDEEEKCDPSTKLVQRNRSSSRRAGMVKKPVLVDHSCQIVHGREVDESRSSRQVDRDVGNHPYKRDAINSAYLKDNGNQFRINDKSSVSESIPVNKKVKVSEDLTIQLRFNGGDQKIKVVPKYGSSTYTKSSDSTQMDKQIQVAHGEHVDYRAIEPRDRHRRNDRDDSPGDYNDKKYRHHRQNYNGSKHHRDYKNHRSTSKNRGTNERTHHRHARQHAKREETKGRFYDDNSDTQYSGGEEFAQEAVSNDTARFDIIIDEKSRSLINTSAKSEGIQADFSSDYGKSIQADFPSEVDTARQIESSSGFRIQADFPSENAAGVQADFSSGFRIQADLSAENATGVQADFSSENAAGVQADFSSENAAGVQADFSDSNCKGIQADFDSNNGVGVQADFDTQTRGSLNTPLEGESQLSSKYLQEEQTLGSVKEEFIDDSFNSEKEMGVEVSIGSSKDMTIELDFASGKETIRERSLGSLKETLREYSDYSGKESMREGPSDSRKESLRERTNGSGKESMMERDMSSGKESRGDQSFKSSKEIVKETDGGSGKESRGDQSFKSSKEVMKETDRGSGKESRGDQSFKSSKEIMKETDRGSGKEIVYENSMGSNKELMLEISLGSDKEFKTDKSLGSEKEELDGRSLTGSGKQYMNERSGPSGSSKESRREYDNASRKEDMIDRSCGSSGKESLREYTHGSGKKDLDYKSLRSGSQKEQLKSRESTNSGKENFQSAGFSDSRKEFYQSKASTGSGKQYLNSNSDGSSKQMMQSNTDDSGKQSLKERTSYPSSKESLIDRSLQASSKEHMHEKPSMYSEKEEFKEASYGSEKEMIEIRIGSDNEYSEKEQEESGPSLNSRKELYKDNSTHTYSEKEILIERGSTSSGKEEIRITSRRTGSGSGKESYQERLTEFSRKEHLNHISEGSIEASSKEYLREKTSLYSDKEIMADFGSSVQSEKEQFFEKSVTSFNSGKEFMKEGSSEIGSEKERLNYREGSSMGSGKEELRYRENTSLGSGKEQLMDREDTSLNSGKEELMYKEDTSLNSGKEELRYRENTSLGSGKEELRYREDTSLGSGKEELIHREDTSLGSGKEELMYKEDTSLGSGKEELRYKEGSSLGSNKEQFIRGPSSSLNSSKKEELAEGTSLSGSGKEHMREKTSQDSDKEMFQEARSMDSDKEKIRDFYEFGPHGSSQLSSQKENFIQPKPYDREDTSFGSDKEYARETTSLGSAKESVVEGVSRGSSKEIYHESSTNGSQKEFFQHRSSTSKPSKRVQDYDPESSLKEYRPKSQLLIELGPDSMSIESKKEVILEESSSTGSQKELFIHEPSESLGSSKEQLRQIQERSSSNLSSDKEIIQIRIEESNGSSSIKGPARKYYDDAALGMSEITMSGKESEEEGTLIPSSRRLVRPKPRPYLVNPSPIPVEPSPQPELFEDQPDGSSYGSAKEQNIIRITEETGSGKEVKFETKETFRDHSSKEHPQSSNLSRHIIEVDLDPESNETGSRTGSSKEQQRPVSVLVPLSKSEYTEGSSKDRLLTESVQPSHSNQITIDSEKEIYMSKSSHGSDKENFRDDMIKERDLQEASSFGSDKEEFQEKSFGSRKELLPASSQEEDFGSLKSRIEDSSQIEVLEADDMSNSESELLKIEDYEDSTEKEFFDEQSSEKDTPLEQISSGSKKETFRETASFGSAKEPFVEQVSSGSGKESSPTVSRGSGKQFIHEQTSSDSPKEDKLDTEKSVDMLFEEIVNSSSSKEYGHDSDISSIKIRFNKDSISLRSAQEKYVEITSGSEDEMDTHQNIQIIDFHHPLDEIEEISDGSSKELAGEVTEGSPKEQYAEPIRLKSEYSDSNKEMMTNKDSSIHDGDLESRESSKEKSFLNGHGFRPKTDLIQSRDMLSIETPIEEESEEEEKMTSTKKESLSSHIEQPSESERESTPSGDEPYMDSRIRNSVLRINTILKKTPTSIQLLARNLIQSKNPPLHLSNPNQPFPQSRPSLREKQRLFEYSDPPSSHLPHPRASTRYKPLEKGSKQSVHRSMDRLPKDPEYNDYSTPKDRWYQNPSSDPPRGVLLSELPFNNQPIAKTSMSSESGGTFNPDPISRQQKHFIDWVTTPIYQEYIEEGINKYNYKKNQAYFDEEEAPAIFTLLKARYEHAKNAKQVRPFFAKAMDTLGQIMGSFMLNHTHKALQKMYTQADVQNTLKLVLRVQKLFQARYLLFQIFHEIIQFKDLSRKIENQLSSRASRDYTTTVYQIKRLLDSLSETNSALQNNLASLVTEHPQVAKEQFVFDNKDWIVFAQQSFDNMNNLVAEHGITQENKYL